MAPSPSNFFTVTDTYEIVEELDLRAALPGTSTIYVMTDKGARLARLVKRVVVPPSAEENI